jgi:cysteine desulfurase
VPHACLIVTSKGKVGYSMADGPLCNLDHNATTAPDPRVVDVVAETMVSASGNPSSQHGLGHLARRVVDLAREQIAAALGASPREVLFTSGATEANNLALLGVWAAADTHGATSTRNTVIVGATEHPAVLEPARALARMHGATVVEAPVHPNGTLDLDVYVDLVTDQTLLVSVMLANNETGVLHPVARAAEIAHAQGALIHTDATQAPGRIPVDLVDLGVDLMSVSGHKMHGPRGVGALLFDAYARVPGGASLFAPLIHGGAQERGLRPGTYNTPGIAGFGVAATLVGERLAQSADLAFRRDAFEAALVERIIDVTVNGASAPRLPNTTNVRFVGADAEAVLAGTPEVACSTGSACSSGIPHVSHVLTVMGLEDSAARECVRFSLSAATSHAELDYAVGHVADTVTHVRAFTTAGIR